MPLRKFFWSFSWLFCLLFSLAANAEEIDIQFNSDPPLPRVRPFIDTVKFSLRLSDSSGQPLVRGMASIVLDAPPPEAFLSTDFPSVEGTRLLEARLPFRRGQLEWRQLLPIRGVYRLTVKAAAVDGRLGQKTFELPVSENRQKKLWLGLFCSGLFLIGFIAGRVFTREATGVAALIFVLGNFALAHEAGKSISPQAAVKAIEVEPPVVGQPTRIRWADGLAGDESATLTLSIMHLEKAKTVLALETLPAEKEFSFNFHFPDGAEYLVKADVQGSGQSIQRTVQNITVAGIEPTLRMQLPSLIFFLVIIAAGLGAGRYSKRW